VDCDGEIVGFALAVAPGASYDSENYRWFTSHFDRFLYLDRIVVAESERRRGFGSQLYDAMEVAARPFERMVCEVNVKPANPASLAFHTSRGYKEFGRLEHGPEKAVALLAKEL
jgi:predicted GNAT superfamily acetyltransferase